MNWLLDTYNSGVADNATTGTGDPDWIVGSSSFDTKSLLIGICIGLTIAIIIWGFTALVKFLISYSEKPDKPNSKESDE